MLILGVNLFLQQNKICPYTGEQLSFGSAKFSKDRTASLDRIDSSKGYISGNAQWVKKEVNFMKQNYSEDKFLGLVEKIFRYRISKPL
jgi:hypothetical protein